jgi:uncharacterized membrane protein
VFWLGGRVRRWSHRSGPPRAVEVERTVTVAAPVERAFEAWSRCERFPRFMARVRAVRSVARDRWRWTVDRTEGGTQDGAPLEWETTVTRYGSNEVVGWETVPGSAIAHSSTVRFARLGPERARVTVRRHYAIGPGAAAGGVLSVLGADPARLLDEDLARFKGLVEAREPAGVAVREG